MVGLGPKQDKGNDGHVKLNLLRETQSTNSRGRACRPILTSRHEAMPQQGVVVGKRPATVGAFYENFKTVRLVCTYTDAWAR